MSSGFGPICITRGLGHAAVHALAADEEEQVRREAGDLLELLGDGIGAAVERMPRRGSSAKICRLANTGASSGSASRTASACAPSRQTSSPKISTGHCASPSRRAMASTVCGRAAAPGRSIWYCAASPICASSPSRMEQLGADGEVHGPRGRRGRLAQRADGGHGDRRRVRVHLVGAARVLGDRRAWTRPGSGPGNGASPR